MRYKIQHGAEFDTLTPEEAEALLKSVARRDTPQRVRASADIVLDGNGSGRDQVYQVPMGFEFMARRIELGLSTAADPSTGNVVLDTSGTYVAYRRSGRLIEYAIPLAPTALAQVPGVQTWSAEEGPYLRNGEVFEVQAAGLTAAATFMVSLEGMLFKRETS